MLRIVTAALALVLAGSVDSIAQAVIVRSPSLVEEYVRSDAVFAGIALKLEHVPCVGVAGDDCVEDRWECAVGQVWKGPSAERVYIYELRGEGSRRFQEGRHYVVYARRREPMHELYVFPSSLTKEANDALVERYSLGRAAVVCDSLQLPEVDAEEAGACLMRVQFRAPLDPAPCDTIILFLDKPD